MIKNSITIIVLYCTFLLPSIEDRVKINEIIASRDTDECYETMMEQWFIEFLKMQDAGLSMDEADQKAAEFALQVYYECQSRE